MIRALRAFVWLRWRLLLNGLKSGARREALETFSRIAGLAAPLLMTVFFGLAAVSLALLALLGGRLMAGRPDAAPAIILAARFLLLVVLGILLLAPLGRSVRGPGSGLTRLLLLPIPRGALHLFEVMAGLSDPWLASIVPALVMLAAGLATAGRSAAALVALIAGLALLCVLGSLGAAVSFFMQWVLRDRRRGEIVTIVFFVLLMMVIPLTGFMADPDEKGVVVRLNRALPSWTMILPTELYGRALAWGLEGRLGMGLLAGGGLLLQASLLYAASALIFRLLLETPEGGRRGGRAATARHARLLALPGLGPAARAVAQAQVRIALRTVRGKLGVYVNAAMMLAFGVIITRFSDDAFGGVIRSHGYLLLGAGLLFGLVSLQPILVNQFAADGAGLSLQMLSPVSDRDLVLGKAAGGAVLMGISAALAVAVSLAVAPGGPFVLWVCAVAGGISLYCLMAPIAALLSAVFPKCSDLSRIGSSGNPHGAASLLATLSTLVCAAPAAIITAVGYHLLLLPGLTVGLSLLWMAASAGLGLAGLRGVARLLPGRRENLALVAQGR